MACKAKAKTAVKRIRGGLGLSDMTYAQVKKGFGLSDREMRQIAKGKYPPGFKTPTK